jgi:hypothetical protein
MFAQGFEKIAKEKEDHTLSRVALGNPISAAIHAGKGKKLKAFRRAYGHAMIESLKGAGMGGAIGAAGGAAIGAAKHGKLKNGLMLGGLGGAYAGLVAGGIKGNYGSAAGKIHKQYQDE